jgi:hypothetical protein
MISPKTIGACTPLAYISCFLSLAPDYMLKVNIIINKE